MKERIEAIADEFIDGIRVFDISCVPLQSADDYYIHFSTKIRKHTAFVGFTKKPSEAEIKKELTKIIKHWNSIGYQWERRKMNVIDYKNLEAGEFLAKVGTDAYKWADAFIQIWGGKLQEVDHSLMVGWFANAIMAQYDKDTAEIERLRGENAEYKSIFTRCRDIVAFHNGDDAEKVEAIRRTLLQKGSSNDE